MTTSTAPALATAMPARPLCAHPACNAPASRWVPIPLTINMRPACDTHGGDSIARIPGTRTTFRRAVYNAAGDTIGHRYAITRDESAPDSVRAWNRDNITPATPRYDRAATVSEWHEVTA